MQIDIIVNLEKRRKGFKHFWIFFYSRDWHNCEPWKMDKVFKTFDDNTLNTGTIYTYNQKHFWILFTPAYEKSKPSLQHEERQEVTDQSAEQFFCGRNIFQASSINITGSFNFWKDCILFLFCNACYTLVSYHRLRHVLLILSFICTKSIHFQDAFEQIFTELSK